MLDGHLSKNYIHQESLGTFETYEPQHETQRIAKDFLKKLSEYIIENKGVPDAVIIGIQGNPGLGKSHLLDSFKKSLKDNNIDFVYNAGEHFLMMAEYKDAKIIIIDDLFQKLKSLNEVSKPELQRIEKMLFDIYEHKKLLLLTSNFDIKEVLDIVSASDQIGRLKDRIVELLGHTQPIKLEGESFRVKKADEAKINSVISGIFSQVGGIIKK